MMTQIIYARDAWFNTFRTKKSLTGADSFGYSLYKIVFSEKDPTFFFFHFSGISPLTLTSFNSKSFAVVVI